MKQPSSLNVSIGRVLMLLAVICFVLAFFGVSLDGRSFVDAGLALLALAFVV